MGKREEHLKEPAPPKPPSRAWTAAKVLVPGLVLYLVNAYLGYPIRVTPTEPSKQSQPVLELREVFVQSTPKPPSSLTSLYAQGTKEGRLALHAWYEDQASQAHTHGYTFPHRLARWTKPAAGYMERMLGVMSKEPQHAITFEASAAAAPMRMVQMAGVGEKVRATGTSRLLNSLRDQYLSSRHGRQHSYWSATPERGVAFEDYYFNNRFAPQDNGDYDSDDDDYPPPDPAKDKWEYYVEDGLRVPNITHKPTLLSLARMAANAYQPTTSETWEQLGDRWDTHDSFGWVSDGLRGHVFADAKNSTVVISFKGTSSTFFLGGGSETSAKDKYNDNRMFSCCCAYVDFSWSTVCDCHMSGFKCNADCLQQNLSDEVADNYFFAASQIFMDVVQRYPDADIILTGHSLGGSVAAMLGLTFGLPAVGFEAVGDMMPSKRLHLPQPPSMVMERIPLFHVGNTADPVFMGVCTGRTSSCYYAGYALESKCHNGRLMVFDTVARRDWRLDIRHHRINEVIYMVFEPWGLYDSEESLPTLEPEDNDCVDCGLWQFVDDDTPQ